MRKTALTFVAAAMMLALACGVALAAVVQGDGGDNRLIGTAKADNIKGLGGGDVVRSLAGKDTVDGGSGDDIIYGGDGPDSIYGGDGFDQISGGEGNDFVSVIGDNAGDFVNCGPGKDTVNEMPGDKGPKNVYKHCEVFAQ